MLCNNMADNLFQRFLIALGNTVSRIQFNVHGNDRDIMSARLLDKFVHNGSLIHQCDRHKRKSVYNIKIYQLEYIHFADVVSVAVIFI